nr:hypothetical protein Iba_chr01cCG2910 [Ipomoea batatas]
MSRLGSIFLINITADSDTDVLIRRKTIQSRTPDEDEAESTNDYGEELEGVVEISSASDSEISTTNMDERHVALQARCKAKDAKKGKAKAVDPVSPDPTLAACLPLVGVTNGVSPTAIALASAHQLRRQMAGNKRVLYSTAPTASKRAKRALDAAPDETKAHVFHRLDQAFTAQDLQRSSHMSAKATYYKEVKNLKVEMANMNASLAEAREGAKKLAEDLKSAREEALKEFKELEALHEEGADDANANALANIASDEIPMDSVYRNSFANLDSIVGMHRAPVLPLVEDDQGDMVDTEEEGPTAALQLNRRCSRSSGRSPSTRAAEG